MGAIYRMIPASIRKRSGFTLIEIIVVLLIASVAVSLAGKGLTEALETFMFDRKVTAMVQDVDYAVRHFNDILRRVIKVKTLTTTGFDCSYLLSDARATVRMSSGISTYDPMYYKFIYPSDSGNGFVAPWGNSSSNQGVMVIEGLGSYPAGEQVINCIGYNNGAFNKYDPRQNGSFDVLLIMAHPFDPDSNVRFKTIVAYRNNRVPNLPTPR